MKKGSTYFIGNYLLMAVAFILFGVIFLVFPEAIGKILSYIFGGFLCLFGIIRVIEYFRKPVSMKENGLAFVNGIIAIGAGIYVFVKPETISGILPIIFGIALLLDALVKLQSTIDMIRLHNEKWTFTLVMMIVTSGLGVLLLADPFKANETFLICVGISLIVNGIMDIIALFVLNYYEKSNHIASKQSTEEKEL